MAPKITIEHRYWTGKWIFERCVPLLLRYTRHAVFKYRRVHQATDQPPYLPDLRAESRPPPAFAPKSAFVGVASWT